MQQSDSAFHAAEANVPTFRWRRSELGYGFAAAGNYVGSSVLNRANEFGEAVLGFGDTDVHG
ncbi:MAG: hypothetical protein A3H97_14420 [Acidobacteria bacterium RIFCSPLOWO2_02_FULL_65_29]|nr:MAG: hypothetical protein A3H97_14420 [Acidobacteria bacterium RIFCSPLOWO2_02_FULL_65_29]